MSHGDNANIAHASTAATPVSQRCTSDVEGDERSQCEQQRYGTQHPLAVTEHLHPRMFEPQPSDRRALLAAERLHEIRVRAVDDVQRDLSLVEPERPIREVLTDA